MTVNRHALSAMVLALSICATAAYATPIIVNGDFETGDLSGWTVFTTANGTNGPTGLPNVVSFNTTGLGASLAAHFDVGEITFTTLPEGGGIEQSFLAPTSGLYTFTADIASQDDASGLVNAAAGTFSILIDGSVVASDNLGGFSTAHQILRGMLDGTDVLGVGTHTIALEITRPFISAGTDTPEQYIDNVAAVAPTTTVPEPASLVLVGGGLIGLTRRIRRGQRRSA